MNEEEIIQDIMRFLAENNHPIKQYYIGVTSDQGARNIGGEPNSKSVMNAHLANGELTDTTAYRQWDCESQEVAVGIAQLFQADGEVMSGEDLKQITGNDSTYVYVFHMNTENS